MRVLIVGDSPRIKTGFGKVNAEALTAFRSKGWDVAALGGLTDKTTPEVDDDLKMYTPSGYNGDVWGFHDVPDVIGEFKPDVIYSTADPGTFVTASSVIEVGNKFVGYVPIEGEPIAQRHWRKMLGVLPFFTCSQYGVDVVRDNLGRKVDFVYHGIDHDVFNTKPRDSGMRDAVRAKMGWEGKFVVIVVATNVRRKQLPRVVEAMSYLKHEFKQKDILCYMHTVPFQHHWLEGWNMEEVTAMYGVSELVQFHPAMNKFNASIPEITGEAGFPGLVELYNAADLFVSASQVEGFGLPTAEAMACGVPVVVPKYAAGWEIAVPAGRGIPIHDWEVHKTSTRYANINPRDLAKEILYLKRNPKELQRMSVAGLRRAQDFQWSAFHDKVVEQVEEVFNDDQSGYTSPQEDDPRPQEEDGLGERIQVGGSEEEIRNDQHLPARKGEDGNAKGPQNESVA